MNVSLPSANTIAREVRHRIIRNTIAFSIILYLLFLWTAYALDGVLVLRTFSKPLAATAAILFGSSFALSGFCYYFDFLDTKIGYRKYLGLVGYVYAMLYSVSLLMVEPETYFYGFAKNFFTPDIQLGVIAMALFTFMAIISNNKVMVSMGPQRWRKVMRVGYVAWLLLAFRAWYLEADLWRNWFVTYQGFPPPRMLLSFFVVGVILFRLSIEVSKRIRRHSAGPAIPS